MSWLFSQALKFRQWSDSLGISCTKGLKTDDDA